MFLYITDINFKTIKIMKSTYSLDCQYYDKSFGSIQELIQDISLNGMDPNYEITRNGAPTGEIAADLLVF